ncbi:tetratricopeptide repeat-containing sulfotransferase family protein [Alteromonas lipotrueae]|uniref:tetratricopeptide repeat-containing sulfotransferase family protein n=1 Tax=Alteromonas lipotrueae TaxID=2803814 RepID=UPI001C48801B|nr:sulfotransferase [Alteromonas lipotrueae]
MKLELQKLVHATRAMDQTLVVSLITGFLNAGLELKENWLGVARLAMTVGCYDLAVQCLHMLDKSKCEETTLAKQLGMLADCGKNDDAYQSAKQWVNKAPTSVAALHIAGVLAYQKGQLEQAETLLKKVVEKAPLAGEAWHMLSTLQNVVAQPDFQSSISAQTVKFNQLPNNVSKACFLNAMGNVNGLIGKEESAFAFYEKSANIMRQITSSNFSSTPYSIDTNHTKITKVLTQIESDTAQSAFIKNVVTSNTFTPVFIMGLPRTGTTLLDNILCSDEGVNSIGETDAFTIACDTVLKKKNSAYDLDTILNCENVELNAIAEEYERIARELGCTESVCVNKSLNNSHIALMIQRVFPNAKFIAIKRDELENAWSIYKTFFSSNLHWSFDIRSVKSAIQMDKRTIDQLRTVIKIEVVELETLKVEPELVLPRIFNSIGLNYENNHAHFHKTPTVVKTASMSQIRQPLNKLNSHISGVPKPFLELYENL